MRNRNADPDEGAILVITLAFLAFFGLVALALLDESGAGLKNSGVVSAFGKKVYNADSAIDLAIQAVRTDATLCPDIAAGTTTISSALAINATSQPVTVTCKTIDDGASGGWRGYSIITTSSDVDSLQTQSGPDKTVTGAIYNAGGITGAKDVLVTGANYYQATAPCDVRAKASPTPPFGTICPAAKPVLDAQLPAMPLISNPPADTTSQPGCTIFSPGKYTSPPDLSKLNYFKSGVYYFDFPSGVGWAISKTTVVGGIPGPDSSNLALPCYPETSPNGSGVEFVLQGSSTISIGNQAKVELYSRRPATPDGTSGISLFVQGSRSVPVLQQTNGNPQVVIHGSVYSPDAEVLTNATGGVSFWMLNGIVAKKLLLQSTGNGLQVSTQGGTTRRRILITASAPGGAGERVVTSRAVIDIAPDDSVAVESRRSQ